MPTDSHDEANSDATEEDRPTEVVRARADRLDRVGPTEFTRHDDPDLHSEVAALRKQLQGYRRTTVLVVPMIVLLVVVVVVVMFASTPEALPEGAGNGTVTVTATTTTTSAVPSVRQSAPATTTTAANSSAATVTVTTAAGAGTAPQRLPAPEVFLNGQYELPSDWTFDFDDGNGAASIGDIIHDGQSVSGNDGAVLAPGRTARDEYTRCATVPAADYRSHIPFTEFTANPILCVQTDEGRLAYAELTDFPTSNGGEYMTFRWTTWEK